MGSIHERLQGLREARELESHTLKEEKEELKRRKSEKYHEEILAAQREQYAKLVVLKDKGILAMVAEATCTTEIEPVWPLSEAEIEEHERLRREERAIRLKEFNSNAQKANPDIESLNRAMGDIRSAFYAKKGDHWVVGSSHPEVTDKLEWDTSVTIEAKKMTQRRRIHGPASYDETDRVTVSYDGDTLEIKGMEMEYQGFIPDSGEMEDAFVRAFDNPEDLRRQPNPWDHTHPELVRY